jgi:membrane fusion protein, macrolide-specific efflux system
MHEPTPHRARRRSGGDARSSSRHSQHGRGRVDFTRRVLTFTAVLGVAVAGLAAWKGATSKEPVRDHASAAVVRADVEDTITALGSIEPRQYVDVGTQVSGQLKRLLVNIGDPVKAGSLVAEIDSAVFSARVDAGHATLANLAAQLEEKRAQHALAQGQHERNLRMFKQDAVSRDALEISQASVRIAAAQVAALLAQADQTRATLRIDEANLAYTRIVAPMSGTVVSLPLRQGQTINANQQTPVILRLANLDTMTVVTQVSEADVVRLRVGMEVYFSTLGLPNRRWTGRLRQILPMPESVNNVVLYSVLFDVDNKGQELKPQMSAQVSFVTAQAKAALTIPVSALRPRAGQDVVADKSAVLVLKEGRVEERRVHLGVANRLQAEVLSGLAEGERVVVETEAHVGGRAKDAARRSAKAG